MAAYSVACRDHSVPVPSRMDIGIFSTQVQNLLAGGYDERDIRAEALVIALEFDLRYGHRGMTQIQRRVQQLYEDEALSRHRTIIAESGAVLPEVAAAIGQLLGTVPGPHDPRDAQHWSRRCAQADCRRTALYGRERCGAHEP